MAVFSTAALSFLSAVSLVLTHLLLISPALSASSNFQCHMKDVDALLEVKRSLGNPSSFNNWNTSISCCEWTGIGCDDARRRVVIFILQLSDATGTISPAIARLDRLEWIRVTGNPRLGGAIPESIGQLTHLSDIQISENPLLTGPIPESICNAPKLVGIDLHLNQLTGPVPGCLGRRIIRINFSSNRLSGAIPGSFMSRRSTNATLTLNLNNNSLAGAIPRSLGDVPIDSVDLSLNRFTDITALFGQKEISAIYASRNELAFDLSNVKFPPNLETLRMDHNKLTGRIPQQVMMLIRLATFDVSYNKLCGPIPTGGLRGRFKDAGMFAHNKCLCGPPLEPCRAQELNIDAYASD